MRPCRYQAECQSAILYTIYTHERRYLLLTVDLHLAFVLLQFRRHQCQLTLEAGHVLGQFERLVLFLRQTTSQVGDFVASSLVLLLFVVQPAP